MQHHRHAPQRRHPRMLRRHHPAHRLQTATIGETSDVVCAGGYKNYLFNSLVISTVRGCNMMIFNRWGQLLYKTDNVNKGWNGYFRGRLCDEGVYVYRVEGDYETGEAFLKVRDVVVR